jgi:hypothetical protein
VERKRGGIKELPHTCQIIKTRYNDRQIQSSIEEIREQIPLNFIFGYETRVEKRSVYTMS